MYFEHCFSLHINLTRYLVNTVFIRYIIIYRCLLVDRKLHYTPNTAALITNACCILHNITQCSASIEFEPLTDAELRRERRLTCRRATFRRARASPSSAAERAARARQLLAGRLRRNALVRQHWRQRNISPN